MKMNKIAVIGLIAVLVIAGIYFGGQYAGNRAAEAEILRVEQERAADEERLAEEARVKAEEEAKLAEEARLKAEEEERLAEEARLKAEEEARVAAEIENGTYLISKNGVSVYTDATKTAVLFEKNKLDNVFVTEEIKNENDEITGYMVKESYDAEAVGYLDAKYLAKAKVDLIARPYDDVDYSAFEKTEGYESNPRVKVRGIFLTGHTAGIESRVDQLIQIADETDINTFVIDVKDDNGYLLFPMEAAETYCPDIDIRVHLKDVAPLIEKLKEHDIYLIGRLVTFKSPKYAQEYPERAIAYKSSGQLLVKDSTYWASPYDRELWAYNVSIAKEVVEAGFNEIQFDYVRFPDTGSKLDQSLDFRNTEGESKTKAIQEFLKYAYGEISPLEAYITADIFGWTATSITDVGIGQHWEAITTVVDYMAPMMYPSHYGPGIFGFDVPNNHPYGTINQSIKDANARNALSESPAIIRPWIQDFSYYGVAEVQDQIRALKENGVDEYMLWNAANNYTVGALNND